MWRDTVCKKTTRHCITCEISDPGQAFTLRGLCEESQIDRGYFLVNGRPEDKERTLMRPGERDANVRRGLSIVFDTLIT